MAEFASPVDAVEAAIEIQNRLKKNISDTSDNIIIEFRMGVNLGDIMVQDNNLYGDNVNIAARLEAVSKPGEICISEKVFQEIKNKVDVKFKFFGNKKLKNISEKINIYISNLNETEENGKSKKFNFKTIGLSALALLSLIILSFTLYNFYFSEKIDYNQNAKNVIDSINSTEDLQSSTSEVDDKTLKISLMEFQIQSENFNEESLNILMSEISKVLTEKDSISTIRSPAGSENLNPPEVMLIATEANSSFVVNGMVFSENNKDYINIKIYEAKRGSLIISKKIILGEDENYDEMVKFLSMFKKDITK